MEIERRAADDLEHLRRWRSAAAAGDRRALARREQARVLDGDDRLSGEILNQFDLLVGKGTHFLAAQPERPDQFAFVQHRNGQ